MKEGIALDSFFSVAGPSDEGNGLLRVPRTTRRTLAPSSCCQDLQDPDPASQLSLEPPILSKSWHQNRVIQQRPPVP